MDTLCELIVRKNTVSQFSCQRVKYQVCLNFFFRTIIYTFRLFLLTASFLMRFFYFSNLLRWVYNLNVHEHKADAFVVNIQKSCSMRPLLSYGQKISTKVKRVSLNILSMHCHVGGGSISYALDVRGDYKQMMISQHQVFVLHPFRAVFSCKNVNVISYL